MNIESSNAMTGPVRKHTARKPENELHWLRGLGAAPFRNLPPSGLLQAGQRLLLQGQSRMGMK